MIGNGKSVSIILNYCRQSFIIEWSYNFSEVKNYIALIALDRYEFK